MFLFSIMDRPIVGKVMRRWRARRSFYTERSMARRAGFLILLLLACFTWPNDSYAYTLFRNYYGLSLSATINGVALVDNPDIEVTHDIGYYGDVQEWVNLDGSANWGSSVTVTVDVSAAADSGVYGYLSISGCDGEPLYAWISELSITIGKRGSTYGSISKQYSESDKVTSTSLSLTVNVDLPVPPTSHFQSELLIWITAKKYQQSSEKPGSCGVETSIFPTLDLLSPPATSSPENYGNPKENPFTMYDGGVCGKGPAACSCSDPGLPGYWVNTATLNLVVQDTEFATSGLGSDVAFTRTWNSASSESGMFGKGWSFAYESRMRSSGDENGTVFYSKGSGQWETYIPSSQVTNPDSSITVTYQPISKGRFDKLEGIFTGIVSQSYYLIEEKRSRLKYRYDHAGTDAEGNQVYRLTSIADRNGNTVVLAYNGDASWPV